MTPQDQEIARLNAEIELVRKEKELLRERYELVVEQRRVETKNYESALSITTLKVDWLAKAKELETLKNETDIELRDAICIDFANKLRVGALADIDKDDDGTLVLKATAYEVYYRACVATLENRLVRVKIDNRGRFADAVKKVKEEKFVKEKEKVERQQAASPQEKMIQAMLLLPGMTRELALVQMEALNAAAKGVKQ